MHKLASIIIRSGVLEEGQLAEFRKWGLVDEVAPLPSPENAEQLTQQIEQAIQEEEMVLIKETDLGILDRFLQTQRRGVLHLDTGNACTDIDISYSTTLVGEYVIPWNSETLPDLLLNRMSHLVTPEGERVYFTDIRELFYGDVRAFMVCTATLESPTQRDLPKEVTDGTEATSNTTDSGSKDGPTS